MPEAYLRQIARLLQMHKELHPERIARRYGVTDEYVRQLWVRYQPHEMAPLTEALETFYDGTLPR
jgi:hypothetical protein